MIARSSHMSGVLAGALLLGFLAAGCGRVSANFPRTQPRGRDNPFADSPLTCSHRGIRFWVGDRIDTAAARARQASVYDPMREAMGESAFGEIRSEARARFPWTTHITGDESCDYYRGSLTLEQDVAFVLEQGAFVFNGLGPDDAGPVRDLGVLFRDGENEREWAFSGTGPVDSREDVAGLLPGRVVLVTFRLPRDAPVAAVKIDTTRIHILAPSENPDGT